MTARRFLLGGMVAAAVVFRGWGLDFDLPWASNIDEPFFVEPAVRMAAGGHLNPGWFGHPASTFIYLLTGMYHCYGAASPGGRLLAANPQLILRHATDPAPFFLAARALSVFLSVAALWFIYRLVRRVFDDDTALATVWLVGVNPEIVRFSKLGRSDGASLFFAALALELSFAAFERPSTAKRLLAGAAIGLAVATKYYLATLAAVLGAIFLHQLWLQPRAWRSELLRTLSSIAAVGAGFIAATPFFVLSWPAALYNLGQEASLFGEEVLSWPRSVLWYLAEGVPRTLDRLQLVALAGGAVLVVKARQLRPLLVLAIPAVFIASISFVQVRWHYWLLPVLPLCIALAAHGLVYGVRKLTLRPEVCAGVVLLVSLPALSLSLAVNRHARQLSTGARARQWLVAHAAPGAGIAHQYDDSSWMRPIVPFSDPYPVQPGLRVHSFRSLAQPGNSLKDLRCRGLDYLVFNQTRVERLGPSREDLELPEKASLLADIRGDDEHPGPWLRIFDLRSITIDRSACPG